MSDSELPAGALEGTVPLKALSTIVKTTMENLLKAMLFGPQGHFTRLVRVVAETRHTVFGRKDDDPEKTILGLVDLIRRQDGRIEALRKKVDDLETDLRRVGSTVFGYEVKDENRYELGLLDVLNRLQPQVLLSLRHGDCKDPAQLAKEFECLDRVNSYHGADEYWRVAAGGPIPPVPAQEKVDG